MTEERLPLNEPLADRRGRRWAVFDLHNKYYGTIGMGP